jgi:hypothetical protein
MSVVERNNAQPIVPTPASFPTHIDWLKEVMIAVLALVTLAALLVAYWAFAKAGDAATQLQNVEKVATSLFAIFAAFVGYYAGRVPAERTATAAQQAANAERALGDQKKDEAKRATALLAQARDRLAPRATAASVPALEADGRLLGEIDAFLNQRS